jgi:L-fuconolactonase
MIIVDSQAHIWGADTPGRPWPPGGDHAAHRKVPLGADELLHAMDEAGVTRCILVPPSWEGDRNDLALAAAARAPDRFAVMGRFPVEDPTQARWLERWRNQPGMLGIRLTLHRSPWQEWFQQGALAWFWQVAEEHGLPIMVYAPGLMKLVDAVAESHPALRLIMDHLSLPLGRKDDEAFHALDDLLRLAPRANVAVKLSALPCHSSEQYPFPKLHPHIQRVFDTFGPKRLFWGSDYSRLPCSYTTAIELVTEALDFLSPQDKEWIMGRAVMTWLDWR